MSIACMNYVWKHSETTGADRLMLLALADSCNDDGEWSPGVTKLATKCKVSERAAQYTLRRLVAMGEIEIQIKKGYKTKTGHTNKYIMKRYQAFADQGETKPTAPLGVQPIAPVSEQGVKPTAPLGVQPIAPNTSDIPTSNNNTPESSSLDDDDVNAVKTVSSTLQKVGVSVSQFMIDRYMELVEECGLPAVVRGILTAAENGKQQRYKYVESCVRNAVNGEKPKPAARPKERFRVLPDQYGNGEKIVEI